MDFFEWIPDELLCHVILFLYNPTDIYNFSTTCQRIYRITNDKLSIINIHNIHNSFEDYGFNYPGNLWLLPMLNAKIFLNFKENMVKSAILFGKPAIMIEEESRNVQKLDDLVSFAGKQKNFDHVEKSFPIYLHGKVKIRYFFKVPKKWRKDFSSIKLRSKHNHLKISDSYKKRIRKRYPGINLENDARSTFYAF